MYVCLFPLTSLLCLSKICPGFEVLKRGRWSIGPICHLNFHRSPSVRPGLTGAQIKADTREWGKILHPSPYRDRKYCTPLLTETGNYASLFIHGPEKLHPSPYRDRKYCIPLHTEKKYCTPLHTETGNIAPLSIQRSEILNPSPYRDKKYCIPLHTGTGNIVSLPIQRPEILHPFSYRDRK